MSDFIEELKARGFWYQSTDDNKVQELMKKPTYVYLGFDCTADSLHVGSLLQIMILRMLVKHGHKAIILLGGGTSIIGDPSFKDSARKMISVEEVEKNKNGIKNTLNKFGLEKAIFVDNAEWLLNIKYIDFLTEYGKYFSVNRMLSFDSVKTRLQRESNLSFLEFNYMLLQAYDFVELNKKYNCKVQIGGSDQWGNIVNGVDLQKRIFTESIQSRTELTREQQDELIKNNENQLYGVTTHLITNSDGSKMGKTVNGAVWLDEKKLSVYDYWQFWRNVDDKDVIKFLKLFTDLDLDYINELSKLEGKEINRAKEILADEATTICHGAEKTEEAKNYSKSIFSGNNNIKETLKISKTEFEQDRLLFKAMKSFDLVKSGGEARRLIKNGGAYINDIKITDPEYSINDNDFNDNICKISAGKKKHIFIELI